MLKSYVSAAKQVPLSTRMTCQELPTYWGVQMSTSLSTINTCWIKNRPYIGEMEKTQLSTSLFDKMRFVDVPGYGYARVLRSVVGRMIEEYDGFRENLVRLSVWWISATRQQDDVQMYEFLSIMRFQFIVATRGRTRFLVLSGTARSAIKRKQLLTQVTTSSLFILLAKAGMDQAWDYQY